MSFFQKRKIKIRFFVLLIVLSIFLLLAVVISPFIMIANEGIFLKTELDNPYIDNKYDGWHWVKINNWGECLFPAQWRITQNADIIQITDESGAVIAIGTALNAEGSIFDSQEAFFSYVFDEKISEISISHIAEFVPINSSFLGTASTLGESEKKCGVFILRANNDSILSELFFVFPEHKDMSTTAMVEITQAVSFSYSFPENCR